MQKIDKILQSNSFIAFKLTGAITQDMSQGYGLHCFDMKKGCWDEEMCRCLGIPMGFLPEICACDHVAGTVTAKAAAECGLAEGTPVVAGGLDAACGTLGAGVIHPGETQEQGGQAGGMSICIDEYKADPRLILGYHVIPGKWLLQGGTTGGGGVMRWFEREFADYERMMKEQTGMSSLNQLNEIAEKIKFRAVTELYFFRICPENVLRSGIRMRKVFLWTRFCKDQRAYGTCLHGRRGTFSAPQS